MARFKVYYCDAAHIYVSNYLNFVAETDIDWPAPEPIQNNNL
jgi:hypothetical protein